MKVSKNFESIFHNDLVYISFCSHNLGMDIKSKINFHGFSAGCKLSIDSLHPALNVNI